MIRTIIILILILGFIAIIILLDLPEVKKVLVLREQLNEQKGFFSEKQTLFDRIERSREDFQGNEENLEKTNYILPTGKDIANLIVQLEALVLQGGLVLEDIGFFASEEPMVSKAEKVRSQEEVPKDYQVLTIDLNLTGEYLAFKNFLKAVEKNMRLMDVSSVNFSAESIERGSIFNFNLIINTYYQ